MTYEFLALPHMGRLGVIGLRSIKLQLPFQKKEDETKEKETKKEKEGTCLNRSHALF